MKKLCNYISKYMGAIVVLVAAIALFLPSSFLWVDTWAINPMLGVIMFGMGLTLSPQDFRIVFSRPNPRSWHWVLFWLAAVLEAQLRT